MNIKTKDFEYLNGKLQNTMPSVNICGTEDCVAKSTITTASTYPVYIDGKSVYNSVEEFISEILKPTPNYVPDRILKSGPATIVFWKDGTKTKQS